MFSECLRISIVRGKSGRGLSMRNKRKANFGFFALVSNCFVTILSEYFLQCFRIFFEVCSWLETHQGDIFIKAKGERIYHWNISWPREFSMARNM